MCLYRSLDKIPIFWYFFQEKKKKKEVELQSRQRGAKERLKEQLPYLDHEFRRGAKLHLS